MLGLGTKLGTKPSYGKKTRIFSNLVLHRAEAKECPKGELPKYEAKADKKPPPLVGR